MVLYGLPADFWIIGLLSIILLVEFIIWTIDDWRK